MKRRTIWLERPANAAAQPRRRSAALSMHSPCDQSAPSGSSFEEFCRRAVSVLLEMEGHTPYCWRNGAQPPDYFLDVHNMSIAVEMTSIHGRGAVGGKQMPWPQIEAEAETKVRPMLRSLEAAYPKAGEHIVTLEPLPDTSNHLMAIKAAVMKYLEMTKELSETAEEQTIWHHGAACIKARKVKPGATRFATPLYLNEGRIGSLDYRLEEFLAQAVESKIDKLVPVKDPKALVILDRYLSQRDLSIWREALPREASTFAFVARVQSEVAEWVLPPPWHRPESGAC